MCRTARTLGLLVSLGVVLGCGGSSDAAGPSPPPVVPPPVAPTTPTITSFTATPSRITGDQSITLAWSVTGGVAGITLPTASLTSARYGVFGTDIGTSFEHNGKALFLSGDTRGENPAVNLGAVDPIAFSTTTNGGAPLLLDFYTHSNGRTVWVTPPGIDMAGHDVPNAGITIGRP